MTDPRLALPEMERTLSRRALLLNIGKGMGVMAAYDRFGSRLFGATTPTDEQNYRAGLQIFGAFGRMVIPVDEDPGWATYEPDITVYGLNVYIRQVFSLGRDLSFNGYMQAVVALNEIPPLINYGRKFLDMPLDAQGLYLTNILTGAFENDGVSDILGFGAVFMLLACKQVFFQNFPKHLPTPGAEFQQVLGNTPKTGWDIMGFRGPVGPDEEKALRARSLNAPELPGVDVRNPLI